MSIPSPELVMFPDFELNIPRYFYSAFDTVTMKPRKTTILPYHFQTSHVHVCKSLMINMEQY